MDIPIELCNRALSKLAQRHITRLNDKQDPVAQQCRLLYHPSRQEVLCACRWSFATKAARLTLNQKKRPKNELLIPPFTQAYELPEDCLRVLDVSLKKWTLRGREILATALAAEEITLTYIEDHEETEHWDPLFSEAFICHLAEKLCLTITGSHSLRQSLQAEYKDLLLPMAAHFNQVQHHSNDEHPLESLLKRSILPL